MPAATTIPKKHKDRKFKFSFDNDEIVMVEEHYKNGRLCIQFYATGECPEPFGTLTMNLPEDDPGENAFFVKTYSENEPLAKELLATGVFVEVQHPREVVWRFV